MVINQPFSIGDLLFIEPICREMWRRNGVKPIVPVMDHLMWISDYIDSAIFVARSKWDINYESAEVTPEYLPLVFANQIHRKMYRHDHSDFENMMLDKYRLANIDPMIWKEMRINFRESKCLDLMDRVVGKEGEDYVLVNETSQAGSIEIKPETDLPVIKMHEIPGFTVLDWAFVMLHARENHHISTCTFYIMQALTTQYGFQGKVVIYPRPNEDGLRGIKNLDPSFKYETR